MNPTLFQETAGLVIFVGKSLSQTFGCSEGSPWPFKEQHFFPGVFAGENNYQIVRLTGVVQEKSLGTGES